MKESRGSVPVTVTKTVIVTGTSRSLQYFAVCSFPPSFLPSFTAKMSLTRDE